MVMERYERGFYTCTGCIRTEMSVSREYCDVKCIGKSRAQNQRKKEGRPATGAGGGGSKKGDVTTYSYWARSLRWKDREAYYTDKGIWVLDRRLLAAMVEEWTSVWLLIPS
ncbi:hypothetical protein QBC32DRAFT_366037 [Pseudoneurospora amorphoporcata]|uniref:Uncharacterized protein n=1 Tax=Pseudoneurospora amorphoporcata TaxID=241081 RepID=A0AAN6SB27_9PEZI|nr:hypothetical protein QBC32DRAFT_366037 [Pseudoneurospora amorphoporcata]